MAKQSAARVKKSEILQEFKRLNLEKRKLEDKLASTQEAIDEVKQKIMNKFEEEGASSSKLETGESIFLFTQYWAKPAEGKTKEDIMAAMKAVGLGHLISEQYNSNSFSAIIREMRKNGEEIPEELQAVIVVDPTYDIRIRGLK